jgi:hypothetical protein
LGQDRLHDLERPGALDGDRHQVRAVFDHDIRPGLRLEGPEDLGQVGRVGDHQPSLLGHPVGDEVVHDATALVE